MCGTLVPRFMPRHGRLSKNCCDQLLLDAGTPHVTGSVGQHGSWITCTRYECWARCTQYLIRGSTSETPTSLKHVTGNISFLCTVTVPLLEFLPSSNWKVRACFGYFDADTLLVTFVHMRSNHFGPGGSWGHKQIASLNVSEQRS